jgi:hypothetical protein
MQRITDDRGRHLPVLENRGAVGVISVGDITGWLLQVNEIGAEKLRRYVFDEYPG